ncbi:hypothetical protein [Nannocystis punicea]|uniref:Uncharacterized protein n=1 Tax=Nannocystis punicea TaxID=2995304 RepID=A0ABY7H3F3_9BACT|nr:hypothetical protein [Nannocystis poenicansa]WAS93801.1 hypothetical protein O0S08_47315 [Nannocystis poenicansa]
MRARELAGASLMALVAACASQDAERVATPAPLDAPAPLPAELQEEAERDNTNDELGFAEYERLLADKETRLQAAGVLLTAREPALGAEMKGDARFAQPPPPPAPGPRGGTVTEEERAGGGAAAKAKRPRKDSGRAADAARAGEAPAPAPMAPKAATTSSTPATRDKNVQYEAKPARGDAEGFVAANDEAPTNRCQNICDLSAATCELEGKICDLAARHSEDPRYGDLCRRADDDCRQAAEACQRCSP